MIDVVRAGSGPAAVVTSATNGAASGLPARSRTPTPTVNRCAAPGASLGGGGRGAAPGGGGCPRLGGCGAPAAGAVVGSTGGLSVRPIDSFVGRSGSNGFGDTWRSRNGAGTGTAVTSAESAPST